MITKNYKLHRLKLSIIEHNSKSCFEIKVKNENFLKSRQNSTRNLIIAALIYILYVVTISQQRWTHHLILSSTFLVFLCHLISLVDTEIVKIVQDIGLEKSTIFSFNRTSDTFIPSSNISGFVINEVIYFVSSYY